MRIKPMSNRNNPIHPSAFGNRCVDNFEFEKILTLIQEKGKQDNSDD
jgi:hypothetical protein